MSSIYGQSKYSSRIGTERRVTIDEVNVKKQIITGKDSYGATLQINFDFQGPITIVPKQGELWIVKQYQSDWRLDRKADHNPMTPITSLSPGDRRLEATGDLYLSGKNVLLNNNPIAANGHGLFVNLPAPGPSNVNTFYYAVDTTTLYFSIGTAWIPFATP